MSRRPVDAPRKPTGKPPATRKPRTPKPEAEVESAILPAAPAGKASGERIAKVLARSGVASRRDAERMIAEGRVHVNGKVIDSPALDVTPKDKILVDGKPMAAPEPPRLWLYHKPEGLVTSARDELGRPTVFDYLPEELPRVMTVGRLDLNSEGLLLLTNDGELKRRLELPSTGWLRRYRVRVNGRPEDTTFDPLREGIVIDGERFQPMIVTIDRQQGANAWLTVAIREGRNREIRRTMEAIGLTVNRLIRISYGPFQLGTLAQGEVEEVRPRILRDQLGLDETPDTVASRSPSIRVARGTSGGGDARPGPAGKPASRGTGVARGKPGQAPGPVRAATGFSRGKARDTEDEAPLAASARRWVTRAVDRETAEQNRNRDERAPARRTAERTEGGFSRGGAAASRGEATGFGRGKPRDEAPAAGRRSFERGDGPAKPAFNRGSARAEGRDGDKPAFGRGKPRDEAPAAGRRSFERGDGPAKPGFNRGSARSEGRDGDKPAFGRGKPRDEAPGAGRGAPRDKAPAGRGKPSGPRKPR